MQPSAQALGKEARGKSPGRGRTKNPRAGNVDAVRCIGRIPSGNRGPEKNAGILRSVCVRLSRTPTPLRMTFVGFTGNAG